MEQGIFGKKNNLNKKENVFKKKESFANEKSNWQLDAIKSSCRLFFCVFWNKGLGYPSVFYIFYEREKCKMMDCVYT